MASSSVEVPYNHETENVLFGQNVIEKIADTCLGQDGKRYYQVKWRDSWEPEERLMAACESALQTFWKEYYCNVEKEIRKQVVSASRGAMVTPDVNPQMVTSSNDPANMNTNSMVEAPNMDNVNQMDAPSNVVVSMNSVVPESFSQQSSMVTYYAVQDQHQNNTIENKTHTSSTTEQTNIREEENNANVLCEQAAVEQHLDQHLGIIPNQLNTTAITDNNVVENTNMQENNEIATQADILTQIINAAPGITATKWSDEKLARRTLTTITADTLNTKVVGGPDSNSKFHCDICMKTFVSKRNVQRHMLSHTGEKPWMCEFCFKRFRQKPHLEQHVNIHKGIKNSVCEICGKAFNHRSNLVTHMATHSDSRPHVCEICGENFKLKHTLSKHMMVHSKQDIEKRHQCKICKKSFRDKSYLAEHETIHRKDKPWQCDVCGKCFSFKRRYQMHLEVHQSKDVEGEYECHYCTKNFKYKIFLQKHLEKHENKRRKKRKSIRLNDTDQLLVIDSESASQENSVTLTTEHVDVAIEKDDNEKNEEATKEISEAENQLMQLAARSNEQSDNLVVASMLPMTSLNMEDATYVALAQLTQAAVDSSPMDESGNVILMSYEDIEQTMRGIQSEQRQGGNVLTAMQMVDKGGSLQIVEQQESHLLPLVSLEKCSELREGEVSVEVVKASTHDTPSINNQQDTSQCANNAMESINTHVSDGQLLSVRQNVDERENKQTGNSGVDIMMQ